MKPCTLFALTYYVHTNLCFSFKHGLEICYSIFFCTLDAFVIKENIVIVHIYIERNIRVRASIQTFEKGKTRAPLFFFFFHYKLSS